MQIKTFEFSPKGKALASLEAQGQDWPVVYLINNESHLYIGETSSFTSRFAQHLENPEKKKLKNIHVIFDDEFNKSATLDIEQSLIRMCSADQKFILLNNNLGQSPKHNYYQREKYLNKIEGTASNNGIWGQLQKLNLANNNYSNIINSDLFKYSPYTTLTLEQEEICYKVLNNILVGLETGQNITEIITGNAGTGKTILAIYIMSLLTAVNTQLIDSYEETLESSNLKVKVLNLMKKYVKNNGVLKIGYVLPMTSIRTTMKIVFKKSRNGLLANMVMGPAEIVGKNFDILIVDEAHRLPKRKNLGWMGRFDECCKKLDLSCKTANTLDWIIKSSRTRILFYDPKQNIKSSDISIEEFEQTIANTKVMRHELLSQIRCKGGNLYTDYLDKIFSCCVEQKQIIENYDIKVFDNPNKMILSIKKLNKKIGLCRNVAGYAWKWKTKGKKLQEIKDRKLFDIKFEDKTYIWNMENVEWILRENAINEIGCIHTVQGYDLNYVGVIFGEEIDYDPTINSIIINRNKFHDTNVKNNVTNTDLKNYIINAYKVMLERGIKGCYIYCCNKNMQNYLKQYLG